jgi:hypothetical protein
MPLHDENGVFRGSLQASLALARDALSDKCSFSGALGQKISAGAILQQKICTR